MSLRCDNISLPETTPKNKTLNEELSELFFEYDELVNHIGPSIESEYISTFGFLEIEAYEIEVEIKKLKKRIQMIQRKINLQEKVDMEEIDIELEEFFREYSESLKQQKMEYEKIIERKGEFDKSGKYLTREETKEMKRKYRDIIKALHPDLNPTLSENEKILFRQATFAFEIGDLEGIRTIHSIIDVISDKETFNDEYLKRRIANMKEKIETYKDSFPYSSIELLKDRKQKMEYMEYLKELIKTSKIEKTHYKERLEELIKDVSEEN